MTLQRRLQLLVAAVGAVLTAVIVVLLFALADFRDDAAYRDSLNPAEANATAEVRAEIVRAEHEADASRSRFIELVIAAIVTAVTLLVLGGLALRFWVVIPVRRLSAEVADVAAGDFTRPIASEGSKELRVLADGVGRMRDRIVSELDALARADESLQQEAPAVAAMRSLLAAAQQDPPPGLSVAGLLVPAEGEMAGDWFDIVRSKDNLLVAVGDICGHGVEAGELALRTKFALLDAMYLGLDPASALELAARRYGERSEFATAIVVEIDPVGGTLRYANAGHNLGVIVRANGDVVELGATGPLIGPVDQFRPNATVDIAEGDLVLVFTDGLVEGRNDEREPFGLDRVVENVITNRGQPVPRVAEALIATARAYFGDRVRDDVTLVVVCVGELDDTA